MRRSILLCFCITFTAVAQQQTTVFEDRPALVLSNDKVALTVITEGGAMAQIVLAEDKDKINPLWNPYWIARQAGQNRPASFARGHFVCIDGFGPVSSEERAAGLTAHGEAYTLPWQLQSHQKTWQHPERRVTRSRCRSHRKPSRGRITSSTARTSSGLTARSPACWDSTARCSGASTRLSALHFSSRARWPWICRPSNRRRRRIRRNRTRHGSCGRLSISPGRWRRRLMARCSTYAPRR